MSKKWEDRFDKCAEAMDTYLGDRVLKAASSCALRTTGRGWSYRSGLVIHFEQSAGATVDVQVRPEFENYVVKVTFLKGSQTVSRSKAVKSLPYISGGWLVLAINQCVDALSSPDLDKGRE